MRLAEFMATCSQGQGQLCTKLHLRPASLTSKFHRQLTAAAARRHVKVHKVKATATVRDPAALKAEREKAEEERIRSRETLQRRQVRCCCGDEPLFMPSL